MKVELSPREVVQVLLDHVSAAHFPGQVVVGDVTLSCEGGRLKLATVEISGPRDEMEAAKVKSMTSALDDIRCGRGMLGVDGAADAEWAVCHADRTLRDIAGQGE